MKEQLDALINQLVDRGILYDEALAEFEKRFIRKILDTYRGNQFRAAEALGIHRNTLSRKLDLSTALTPATSAGALPAPHAAGARLAQKQNSRPALHRTGVEIQSAC